MGIDEMYVDGLWAGKNTSDISSFEAAIAFSLIIEVSSAWAGFGGLMGDVGTGDAGPGDDGMGIVVMSCICVFLRLKAAFGAEGGMGIASVDLIGPVSPSKSIYTGSAE